MSERARPLKRFGQNFLVRRSAIRRIVDALAPSTGDAVLEIGPGRGALTEELLDRVDRLAAVELDRRLAEELRARFPLDRLALIERDVLDLELSDAANALDLPVATSWLVVGNLPYNISKPLAMRLIRQRNSIRRAVLMFQWEVARRLTAEPGSKEYGPLTVLAGRTFRIRLSFRLPPSAFRPAPKVDSAVTVWEPRVGEPLGEAAEARLRHCLSACFARRRRTLRNNLRNALGAEPAERLLESVSIDGERRAESLPPEAFERIADAWPETI